MEHGAKYCIFCNEDKGTTACQCSELTLPQKVALKQQIEAMLDELRKSIRADLRKDIRL